MDPSRALRNALLLLVVAYGTLLRFDALTLSYGVVESPGWLRALQESRGAESSIRPDGFKWERWQGRYISDPYTYLVFAREMRSFYAAHHREPVFPFATKVSLRILDNQDIAVSFASLFFSVLALVATYLLARAAFNRWIGLGAAAALAIEYDAVTWGVGGWRDDAFMCGVVLSCWAMLRVMRVPSRANAVILGVVAAATLLTRITALSFLLPGFAFLLLVTPRPSRARLQPVWLAAAVAILLAGPYLVNCWRTFGDPLYAINVHADVYRATEGQTVEARQTAGDYVRTTLTTRPWTSFDTALQGMTTYPFTNKWTGFDRWSGHLGRVLSWLSIAGLLLFAWTREGRLLLVILAGSLVPYALTWKLIFDWRFTMHVYPFFLIAAFHAIDQLALCLHPSRMRELMQRRPGRGAALAWTATLALVAAGVAFTWRLLPPRVAAETLRAGEPLSFGPYHRDRIYFGEGWSGPVQEGNVVARVSEGRVARLWLPLPEQRDHVMTIRMDPFPAPASPEAPLPVVRVLVNDKLVRIVDLQWDPERIGSYRLTLPAAAMTGGPTRLSLMASDREGRVTSIRFWYVRVRPTPRE